MRGGVLGGRRVVPAGIAVNQRPQFGARRCRAFFIFQRKKTKTPGFVASKATTPLY